jgi:hypothetical protein
MPTPKIIEIDEEQDVVCPICNAMIVDVDEGLVEQPSCRHILFVYANGEAFEYDPAGLEGRLEQERDRADEAGDYFDEWETVLSLCDKDDLILSLVSEGMACGAISFTVWIGIRSETKNSDSRCHLVRATSKTEFSSQDRDRYFRPTPAFIRWVKTHYGNKHICEIGAGVGHIAKALAETGLHVTALDLEPRTESEFDVIKADSTTHPFEEGSVVLLCRPCHNGFVPRTIANAIQRHIAAILYVGLRKNFKSDVGSIHNMFTKRRVGMVGRSDERVWELNVGRLRAEASLRRGIPRLSSEFSR